MMLMMCVAMLLVLFNVPRTALVGLVEKILASCQLGKQDPYQYAL
jgi:hypothetical protein